MHKQVSRRSRPQTSGGTDGLGVSAPKLVVLALRSRPAPRARPKWVRATSIEDAVKASLIATPSASRSNLHREAHRPNRERRDSPLEGTKDGSGLGHRHTILLQFPHAKAVADIDSHGDEAGKPEHGSQGL